ncbi:hypothetical protein HK097_003711 [Rhizophlyctis rosea]|uniref:Cas1p 10 TM acyl transferase domain-containing protein n=1 Tax=Rhizophlyctis rosea TaxID=64517 RepID=A0AAD5SJH1_9FUNG|nr:hypothetical protein HK097_003711 [Rhizophlyctis rosea]
MDKQKKTPVNMPSIVMLSAGFWFMKDTPQPHKNGVERFSSSLSSLLNTLTTTSPPDTPIIIRPVNPLVPSLLSPDRQKVMTNSRVLAYNRHLRQTTPSNVRLPEYIYRVNEAGALNGRTEDGFHYDEKVVGSEVEMLLNDLCNERMFGGPLSMSKTTCCVKDGAPGWKQVFVLGLGWVFGCLVWAWRALKMGGGKGEGSMFIPSEQTALQIAKLTLTLTYLFITDRTLIFDRVQKAYTTSHFIILSLLFIIIPGIATLRSSPSQTFLNRHQTDEWKGWMQLVILVYHYTGASKVTVIYNAVRCLVASYLFMTGYGHFTFFYSKGDFGVGRVVKVLVRLLLLGIGMAEVMGRDGLFYYFGPLVGWWFLIVYFTVWLGSGKNGDWRWIVGKWTGVGGVCWWVIRGEEKVGEKGLDVLAKVVGTEWDVREAMFRIGLDQWIVTAGMVVAWVVIKVNSGDWKILSVHGADPRVWMRAKGTGVLTAAIWLAGFAWFESSFTDKFAYNLWHPYVSVPAVVAFVVLRNATPALRQTTSRYWCWVGTFSLETFLLQYHMWLGVDTRGILKVLGGGGEGWWWANLAICSVVFFGLSELMADVTGRLVESVVGKEKGREGWRVLGWCIVLIALNWL